MLDELLVVNLGIITEASMEPGPGFVVVTGETGAGKTLLMGALQLLIGEPARRDQVGPGGDELRVEGRFQWAGGEHVAARRVSREGRSRAYVDGAMVPAKALSTSTGGLVEIVAQHDHLALAAAAGVRAMIDGALDAKGRKAVVGYEAAWETLVGLRHEAELLGGDRRALERELDMVRFQAEEIVGAGFEPGDDTTLAVEADRLRNRETLLEGFAASSDALGAERGAGEQLARAASELRRLVRYDPGLEDLAVQAEELVGLVDELSGGVTRAAGELDHDPAALQAVEVELARLGDLRRKYGDSLNEVLAYGAQAEARAAELVRLLDRADSLAGELTAAEAAAHEAADELRHHRATTADRIARDAVTHLKELGFRSPTVSFSFEIAELGPTGGDRTTLRFASDAGLTPGPVGRIASGGELSRLVLALRLAAGVGEAEVVAFDEIDAGIGGTTALAMGRKLAALAAGRQVFCVTHLPQVAAFADQHFVVRREGAAAAVAVVAGTDRLEELSRMLAGMPESERGKEHAAELLEAAGKSEILTDLG
jgi:DNA repair protein RecN (Recombination protein N)